jgi:hypothetical protein
MAKDAAQVLGAGGARVIGETLGKKAAKDIDNFTSAQKLSSSELLEAGEQFLGKNYKELDSGVFRSADDLRGFRIDNSSVLGKHGEMGPPRTF